MRIAQKSATPFALVLLLTACGGGTDEAPAPADTAAVEPGEIDPAATVPELLEPGETPALDATPAPETTPTPGQTASPSPTPAATTAAATPTPAAPATVPGAFALCAACHSIAPGEQGIGPTLAGVFGARAGAQSGFESSQAMKDSGLTWNQANLDRYLADPRATVPGTTMAFAGVRNAAQRQAIIDYMRSL
jgi:cytochrome c